MRRRNKHWIDIEGMYKGEGGGVGVGCVFNDPLSDLLEQILAEFHRTKTRYNCCRFLLQIFTQVLSKWLWNQQAVNFFFDTASVNGNPWNRWTNLQYCLCLIQCNSHICIPHIPSVHLVHFEWKQSTRKLGCLNQKVINLESVCMLRFRVHPMSPVLQRTE